MRKTILAVGIAASLWPLASNSAAQFGGAGAATFRPRFNTMDRRALTGECKIRVRVDNEAEVIMFDDQVTVRTISGSPGYDVGSECTSPLPRNGVIDFSFRKTDGPGEARVLRRPDNRNGQVALYVRDSDGGDHKYTLEFRWTAENRGGDWRDRDDDRFDNRLPPRGGRGGGPLEACTAAVRLRIREQGYSDPEISRADLDSNPGRRASVNGEATGRGRGRREQFQFECNVDPATDHVRNVRVWRR